LVDKPHPLHLPNQYLDSPHQPHLYLDNLHQFLVSNQRLCLVSLLLRLKRQVHLVLLSGVQVLLGKLQEVYLVEVQLLVALQLAQPLELLVQVHLKPQLHLTRYLEEMHFLVWGQTRP